MGKTLSDAAIKRAMPRDRDWKLFDANGLYVLINTRGSKLWRFRYRFNGKEKLLSLGKYPHVSLMNARKARDEARAELLADRDPSLTRKERRARAANLDDTFRAVSTQWLDHNAPRWTCRHVQTIRRRIEQTIWPALGDLPLSSITVPMVLQLCRSIEKGKPSEIARRVRQYMSAVFCYGIASGLAEDDPAARIASVLLPSPRTHHHPAITDLAALQAMMKKVEAEPGKPVTKLAFRMLALTATRSAEVRGMRWDEIDGDVWTIPAERMKMSRDHVVPLARQALDILEAIKLLTGRSPLVFAGDRYIDRPMSDMTLSMRLKRAGYSGVHVPHGFRSSFSSIMNELRPHDRMIIDQMLAHETRSRVEAAYNRAEHLKKRKEIAQTWADLLLDGAMDVKDLMMGPRH